MTVPDRGSQPEAASEREPEAASAVEPEGTFAVRPDPDRLNCESSSPSPSRAAPEPPPRAATDGAAPEPPPHTAPQRTKAAQGEATTSALIAAARELFAERGYADVGTEEIVQRAGVTRGALYHHFKGGKEDLFRAVLVQVSADTLRRVVAQASGEDPWQELVRGAEAFLDACGTREVQRIMFVDGPAVLGWDVWRAIDAEHGLGLLEQAVQAAMDAGKLLPGSARAVAHVLSGALDEAAMVVARAEDPKAAREEMGLTVRRLLEGLRGPQA